MKKIYLDFPEHICSAVCFNFTLGGYEFLGEGDGADLRLSSADFSGSKLRVGEVVDKITRDYGAVLSFGQLEINLNTRIAKREGAEVKLTEKEAGLLSLLSLSGGFVKRSKILQDVWGYSQEVDTKTVEAHVHRLNQKMEEVFGFKIVEHQGGLYKISCL